MASCRRFAAPCLAALVLTAADQGTKSWIVGHLGLSEARAVADNFLHIVHVRNRGVAFGFLSGLDSRWVNPLLIGATLLAVAAILVSLRSLSARGPAPCGLGLVLGGAVGNLIDRARLGYVVDFIDVHAGRFHWPAFNVADIGITAGVGLLLLDILFWSREDQRAPRPR